MVASPSAGVLLCAIEGTELTGEERDFFGNCFPAGVTLFRRNISPRFVEVKKLTSDLQGLRPSGADPFLVAVDQEGGRVSRIPEPFPNLGPVLNLSVEKSGNEHFFENYGFCVGSGLRALGINTNFAPVCDILTREENTAIGDRVFGRDTNSVATLAGKYLSGLGAAKVLGCLKHFPGQGGADADTHLGGSSISLSAEALWQQELQPFIRLHENSPMVMISHCVYPALDSRPASLSKVIITDLLREKLGYSGVVVGDDMNMQAMPQDTHDWVEAIVESIMAGVDLVLVCRHLDKCYEAVTGLEKARRSSPSLQKRLDEALQKVASLRQRLNLS